MSAANQTRNARLSAQNSSFIEAVEAGVLSAQMREARQADYNRVFMGLLFCLFVIVLLLVIVVGVHIYGVVSSDQVDDSAERLATSLLVNDVRASDSWDSIASGTGPEGPSLVLVERVNGESYETRIYLYQEQIVQEYRRAGDAYRPAEATPIVSSRTFSFEYADGLLSLITDEGTSKVALRSVRGA